MKSLSWRPQPLDSCPLLPREIIAFLKKNRDASAQFVNERSQRDAWFKEHLFRPSANLCIDERVQDFDEATGLPTGILEAFRAGGSKSSLSSLPYARRCFDGVARLSPVQCDGSGRPDARGCADRIQRFDASPCDGSYRAMVEMRMVTYHYSQSHPRHSCAAWNHQTDAAIEAMKDRAVDLNLAFRGRMVAFPVGIDTDVDGMTLVGHAGQAISVRAYDSETPGILLRERLIRDLRTAFPLDWEPLAALDHPFRDAFHRELSERMEANIRYVRNAFGRPPELLDHKGELVFVGRHADWIREHNSVFLIDDTEDRTDVLAYFGLALRYVARNVIRRAIVDRNDDWIVPVIINIPFDGEMDEMVTKLYAHKLRVDLERHMREVAGSAREWILRGPDAIPSGEVPDKMFRQIHALEERVHFLTAVSRRCDRLFRPFM